MIHALPLELVSSVSAEETLLAIRWLISRRGKPVVLMSDNAKGVKAAAAKKAKVLRPEGPKWKFIPPRAPWHGGYWERMVQSIKNSLKKSVGKRALTRVELETVLLDIEGILNSRTLTFVGNDLDTGVLLTPSNFLIDRHVKSKCPVNDEVPEISPEDMALLMEYCKELVDVFWHRWTKEYRRFLPPYKGGPVEDSIKIGTVVILHNEGSLRLQ